MQALLHSIQHQGRPYLQLIQNGYIPQLPKKMRQIRGAFWQPNVGWLIPDHPTTRIQTQQLLGIPETHIPTTAYPSNYKTTQIPVHFFADSFISQSPLCALPRF